MNRSNVSARRQTSVRRITLPLMATQVMQDVRPSTARRHTAPDCLRTTWQAWRERQPASRTHAQAAAALHVAEAVLLAALEGNGVVQLRPDLADLLAPAASWGRMVLEIRHSLGTARLLMQPNPVRLEPRTVVLVDGIQRAWFATHGVAHCYLVSEPEMGRYGLHWFNRDGDVIARLSLPAGPHQQLAMAHLLQFMITDPKRAPQPPQERSADLQAQAQWCAIDTTIRSAVTLAHIGQKVGAAVSHLPALQVAVQGDDAAMSYRGPVGTNGTDPDRSQPCQLQIDPDALTHAFICIAPDDTPFLRLHGAQTGSIGLTPDLDPLAAWSWLRTLGALQLR
jgi:hypothetical protein